jgi:hypothetical protein
MKSGRPSKRRVFPRRAKSLRRVEDQRRKEFWARIHADLKPLRRTGS